MISNKHFKLIDAVSFEYLHMTQLSQATVDCTVTLVRDGVETKFSIPPGVSYRLRKSIGNVSKFSVAHPICVAFVGDRIVSADCPIRAALPDARKGKWKSIIDINLTLFKAPANAYFDGQYIYTIDAEPEVFDRNFGVLKLTACYDMFHCGDPVWTSSPRACFAYQAAKGKWVVTAPCTNSAGSFLQLIADDVSNNTAAVYDSVDMIDKIRFVNLRFVNYAAGRLANAFDFETIEPLGLPLLMIEHGTFNLGELTPTVQMTCPAPLTFSQTLAWLTGLCNRATTLGQFITVKDCIKMLMSKGCTRTASVVGAGEELDDGATDVSKNEIVYAARKHYNSLPMMNFS